MVALRTEFYNISIILLPIFSLREWLKYDKSSICYNYQILLFILAKEDFVYCEEDNLSL